MNEKYPIGQFQFEGEITPSVREGWIKEIERLPLKLKEAVKDLSDVQLNTPYRNGGWTVWQVVHHVADSHMNAYIRFKLALTEDKPIIKPYEEARWAELADYSLPIDVSLALLDALHERWTALLKDLTLSELKKTFIHPESGEISLEKNIGLYAWHGRHHVAHIESLKTKMGWDN
ncbi:YfiT family bacillithiol transferase [Heyndrickxia acidicola]|uniref:Putative metal-dependent hydrolase P4T90_13055 n=1 Tax=Heyndrickxia acidicola TaxID=209389 RepID=A0ABU6MH37_9BACI|nr:bacillithiol transferase BstA [Heyndrickxia acidicola]MED1203982.1 bacillithiol transferase BstA [Heyndrickxia acidicola]